MAERILVVDDELNMLKLLKTILTDRTGYEVDTVNNSSEVNRLLEEKPYDLLVADLKMPVIDGIDLIGIIKKISPGLPIIIITAYGTTEAAREAVEQGAFDFITKPFRKKDIINTVKRGLEWKMVQSKF